MYNINIILSFRIKTAILPERPGDVMKLRKSAIVLIVTVLLLAAAFIYFDTRLLDHIKLTSQKDAISETDINKTQKDQIDEEQGDAAAAKDNGAVDLPDDLSDNDDSDTNDMFIAYENVSVSYNTPEYDISVMLCESPEQKTFIRLQYYMNGVSTVNELDEEQIAELTGIFEGRGELPQAGEAQQSEGQQDGSVTNADQDTQNKPYAIGQALLNPAHGQLYLLINGASVNGFMQSSFYLVDLNDLSVKKLFSYPAKYGRMSFNRDFSMLAYSFTDPAHMSSYQEDELLEVFDCMNGEFLVKGSRKADQSLIGTNSDPDFIYDYIFIGWHTLDMVKLDQTVRTKDNADTEPICINVYYDIKSDLLLDADGNTISMDNIIGSGQDSSADENGTGSRDGDSGTDGNADLGGATKENGDDPADTDPGQSPEDGADTSKADDSEPVRLLKGFYSCLGSTSQYPNAMQMLDDGFVLRLGMLKQFGIDEIHKRDIDAQYSDSNVTIYADLFKTARFDKLVSERVVDDNTAVIRYYQTLGLSVDSQFRQLITATLIKRNDGWIITLIEDGT